MLIKVGCTYCRHEFEVSEEDVTKNGPCYAVRPGRAIPCPNVECGYVYQPSRLLVNPAEVVTWKENKPQGEA